jgi:hypothetical protein
LKASAWALLSRMQTLLPNRSDVSARCIFSFSNSNYSSPQNSSNISSYAVYAANFAAVEVSSLAGSDISLRTCVVPPAPPLGVWTVKIVLADGRNSSNAVYVQTICPNNYFLRNKGCV